MKRLGVLCVLAFLPLGVMAQTYDVADFFPLGVGDQWVYQEQESSSIYQVDVTGTRIIDSVVTSIFELTGRDIPKEFFGIDSAGVLALYGVAYDFGSPFDEVEIIPDSPFPIGDSDIMVGDIFTYSEEIEIADLGWPIGEIYADVTYTASYTNAGEIAVTPALVFSDTLTLRNTLHFFVDNPVGDDIDKTYTEDVIVARGTGVVRITDVDGTDVYNLISALINGGPLPDLLNNSSVTYTFDLGPERWGAGGAPVIFTPPTTSSTSGMLGLHSTINTNTFGFWTSLNELYMQADTLYRAQCTVSTDITDPTLVPELRLRLNTQNNQLASILDVVSNSGAESAPTPGGQTYSLYFCPHNSGISSFVPTMSLAFDLLNFNPDDAATASLLLDDVTISRVDLASLTGFTSIPGATASFTSSTDGWTSFSTIVFSAPNTTNSGNGSLRLLAPDDFTFGGWQSPTIALESNMAYRARFQVSSDLTDPALVSSFRMRLNTNNLEMSAMLTVTSTGQGEASPTTTPKDYWVYFAPPASALAEGMVAAIDILDFDSADSGTIQLEEFSIEKAVLPLFP